MNKEERQRAINNTLRLIDFHSKSGSHVNCIRINTNNTLEHEIEKLKICFWIIKNGGAVLTEGKFENGEGTPDIINLVEGSIIEIVHTETEESIKKKIEKYPLPIEVVKVE